MLNKLENMSEIRSERRKTKELKVLELYDKGFSYRKIASLVHLSLRDVTKYIHRISNKTNTPSTTSLMDEVVLEYRVNNLLHEVRDLKIEKDNLKNEIRDLRAQKYDLQNQMSRRQLGGHERGFEIQRKFSDYV